ncbi:MAG: hypothetical protein WBA51_15765 [Erythrobacter sp.]
MGKLITFGLVGTIAAITVITSMQSLDNTIENEPGSAALAQTSTGPFGEVDLAGEEAENDVVEGFKVPEPTPAKPASSASKDMDQVDHMIAATINLSGNLCARPIEVRDAGDGLYGVRCITNRNGTGMSDYIVNSRNSEVIPI